SLYTPYTMPTMTRRLHAQRVTEFKIHGPRRRATASQPKPLQAGSPPPLLPGLLERSNTNTNFFSFGSSARWLDPTRVNNRYYLPPRRRGERAREPSHGGPRGTQCSSARPFLPLGTRNPERCMRENETRKLPLAKGGQGREWEISEDDVLRAPAAVIGLVALLTVGGVFYVAARILGALVW